jgi:hypothetical protein
VAGWFRGGCDLSQKYFWSGRQSFGPPADG